MKNYPKYANVFASGVTTTFEELWNGTNGMSINLARFM